MPTVDLNLGPPPAQPQTNPLNQLGEIAPILNQLNQNRLFQQQFQARQAAGQIIATSPDMTTAVQRMQGNPQVAGFLPEIMQTAAGVQGALLNNAKALQDLKSSGLAGVYAALGPSLADPSTFEDNWKRSISTLAPEVQKDLGGTLSNIHDVLGPMAKNDPDGFKRQVTAGMLQSAPPDRVFPATGAVPPQLVPTAGGLPILAGGLGQSPGGGQNPLSVGITPSGAAQPNTPTAQPNGPTNATANAPMAGDGTALLAPDTALPKGHGANTLIASGPLAVDRAKGQNSTFDSPEAVKSYALGGQALANSTMVENDIKTLAQSGGWMTPGALGQLRSSVGQFINTAERMTGAPPTFDPSTLATSEDLMKDTKRLGMGLLNQMFGGQREATQTIQTAIGAVPGIENSPLGGLLVNDMIRAGVQWNMDQRTYQNDFRFRNNNDLADSDTKFMAAHPATGYVQKVLDKYGLTADGFKDSGAIAGALKNQLITSKQAYDAALKQGFISQGIYDSAKARGFSTTAQPNTPTAQ